MKRKLIAMLAAATMLASNLPVLASGADASIYVST